MCNHPRFVKNGLLRCGGLSNREEQVAESLGHEVIYPMLRIETGLLDETKTAESEVDINEIYRLRLIPTECDLAPECRDQWAETVKGIIASRDAHIAEWRALEAKCEMAKEASGYNAAAREVRPRHERWCDVEAKILGTPARTIAGLAVQAKFIERHIRFSDPDVPEHDTIKTMAVTLRDMAPVYKKALAPTKYMPA